MKVYFDESPMGSGKTARMLQILHKRECKVLLITERIESFCELKDRLSAEALRQGTIPLIEAVHSDSRSRVATVSRQIEALPERHQCRDHVIVIATHAAMLRSDFSDLAGWEIIVDEVPQFLDFEEKRTHLDSAFFQRFYELHPLTDGWSFVRATTNGIAETPSSLRLDQSHEHLAVFHRRVLEASKPDSKRFVVCNLTDWTEMEDREIQWCWASAFSLQELAAFDKVVLLGNRFRADIGSRASQALTIEPIQWIELPRLNGMGSFAHRPVHINYFAHERTASRALFESETGQAMLCEIGKRLASELNGHQHIWTANNPAAGVWTPRVCLEQGGMASGKYISPRQAGTNQYRKVSHAAAIYSAKASPNLVALLKVLGIDRSAWERSVEHETILQFVTRTSIRDADNSSAVHLWVFDRAQAQYLKSYFDGLPYVTAHIQQVEDAPDVPTLGKRGPKRKVRTPDEQAAYRAEKRARDAARKREARALEKLNKAA